MRKNVRLLLFLLVLLVCMWNIILLCFSSVPFPFPHILPGTHTGHEKPQVKGGCELWFSSISTESLEVSWRYWEVGQNQQVHLETDAIHFQLWMKPVDFIISLDQEETMDAEAIKIYDGKETNLIVGGLHHSTSYSFFLYVKKRHGACKIETIRTKEALNLVRNPSFEVEGEPKYKELLYVQHPPSADQWQPFSLGYFLAGASKEFLPVTRQGNRSVAITIGTNNPDTCGAYQLVRINPGDFIAKASPLSLTISAWSYAKDVTGGMDSNYGVTVEMGFSDGSRIEDMVLEFNPAINRKWQHRCMVAHIDAHSKDSHQALHTHPRVPQQQGHQEHRSVELQWISVFAIFRTPHSGTVYFDDISVFPTTGLPWPHPDVSEGMRGTTCEHKHFISFHPTSTRRHPFFFRAEQAFDEEGASLVVHLSSERLDRLLRMVDHYEGVISAAIWARNEDVPELLKLHRHHSLFRSKVDLHILYSDQGPYPANSLRNLALDHCRTRYAVLLDVDFIPCYRMHGSLVNILRGINPANAGHKAFVVAAFEADVGTEGEGPVGIIQLKDLLNSQQARPVHIQKTVQAHGPTDYQRWYKLHGLHSTEASVELAEELYQVDYELHYEPYVVVDARRLTRFDERFRGYGHDKEAHAYQLHKAGYEFWVLPQVFVIHMPHPPAPWSDYTRWIRVEKNWYSFIATTGYKDGESDDLLST